MGRSRKRSRRKSRVRGQRLWRWLSVGAFGLGAGVGAAVWLRQRKVEPGAGGAMTAGRPAGTGDHSGSEAAAAGEGAQATESELQALPANAQVAWIAAPGGSVRLCDSQTSGDLPVVFVHGLGGRLEQWAQVLSALGPRYRGVAFDLPGHGGSDSLPDGRHGPEELSATLASVVDSLRLRRFVIVAHSLGALPALHYAADHPGRVSGLYLVDPNGDLTRAPAEQTKAFLEPLREDPKGELEWYFRQLLSRSHEGVREAVLNSLRETEDEVLLSALEGGARFASFDALRRYPGPVACIASGLNDLPHSLPRLRPEMPCTMVEEAGHWLMLERPQQLGEDLDRLLTRAYRQRPAAVH